MISVAVNKLNTHFIPVDRGVLQGDPSSPLLFNLCFNPLMRTLSQPKFKHLRYMWGPNVDPYSSSWLQFADDTAIIANDVKSAQTLINLNVAWCKWSGMHLRIDKCVSFGMRKQEGVYSQYLPNLTINDSKIPALELGSSFKYLGKLFNFEMNNDEAKSNLINRLSGFLEIIKNLKVKVTIKLKILRIFIPSQFNFDLRIYDFAYTWIEQNLDQLSVNAVNEWLELPNGTCTAEFLQLPMKQGGYGIPSMKTTAQRLRLSLRFRLKHNIDDDLRDIWHATSNNNNIPLDALIIKHQTKSSAMEALEFDHQNAATQHVTSLKVQGSVSNHQGSIRGIDHLCLVHHELQSSWRPLLIRQKSIPATIANGFEFVSMEKNRVGQMWTVWISPDKQTNAEQLQLPVSSPKIQISPWSRAGDTGAMDTCNGQRQSRGVHWSRRSFVQATLHSVHFAATWHCHQT